MPSRQIRVLSAIDVTEAASFGGFDPRLHPPLSVLVHSFMSKGAGDQRTSRLNRQDLVPESILMRSQPQSLTPCPTHCFAVRRHRCKHKSDSSHNTWFGLDAEGARMPPHRINSRDSCRRRNDPSFAPTCHGVLVDTQHAENDGTRTGS